MKFSLTAFIRSFLFFSGNLFKNRKYDIVFYYPAHFNRGKEGKNKFFDPLYHVCDRHGLRYLVIEEPDFSKRLVRNPSTVPFDTVFFIILVLRKLLPRGSFETGQHKDWYIAKLLKPLFFRKFEFENYVVLSNSMHAFFRGLNPEASLYDYQHGVIFAGHTGYFYPDMSTVNHIKLNRVELLLHGEGFQKMFAKYSADGYYKDHTHVIGFNAPIYDENIKPKKFILFSLQFTGTDEFGDHQDDWLDIIDGFLKKNEKYFTDNGLVVIFKKHPRHDPSIDLSRLFAYPFTRESTKEINVLLQEAFLHITFYSSSLFDASAHGVPTLLWMHQYSLANIFKENFDYPLGHYDSKGLIEKIDTYLKNSQQYKKDREQILQWYRQIYSPLDEKKFIALMKREKPASCPLDYSYKSQKQHNTRLATKVLYFLLHWLQVNRLFYFLNRKRQRILTYHNIIPDELYDDTLHLGVSHNSSTFKFHLDFFAKTLPVTTDLGRPSSILITFDDGYKNNYHVAMPLLDSISLKAYFFIPVDAVLKRDILWIDKLLLWLSYVPAGNYKIVDIFIEIDEQLSSRQKALCKIMQHLLHDYSIKKRLVEALHKAYSFDKLSVPSALKKVRFEHLDSKEIDRMKDAGHFIGCHSFSHDILSKLDKKTVRDNIMKAEFYIGKLFNVPMYSYPFGGVEEVDRETIEILETSSFQYAFVNTDSANGKFEFSRYAMPRLSLPNTTDTYILHAKLSGSDYFLRHFRLLPNIGAML